VKEVRLVSRTARPCGARPWAGDDRRLGVSVSGIRIRRGSEVARLPLDGPEFGGGWWALEHSDGQMWRWTDGDAVLRLPEGHGAIRLLELMIGGGLIYPLHATADNAPQAIAAAA
jgi:hypothetical protein